MFMIILSHLLMMSFLHPFHVSVCEINYNEANKSLEITHRIFLDDLEETLRIYSGNPKLDVLKESDAKEVNRLLALYFSERFTLKVNGANVVPNYLGEEREDDVMYCYIEVANVAPVKIIEVENKILLEIFSDQMNLIHIKAYGNTKSLRLKNNQEWGELKFL